MQDIRADRRAFLGTLAALGVSGQLGRAGPADDVNAGALALARKVEAVYGSCKTYRDSGHAEQVLRGLPEQPKAAAGEPRPRKITTAFVRPDRFRFEFDGERAGKPVRHLIWTDGPAVKTWWDVRPGVGTPESLKFALGAAAGVTESSSMTIPPLLLPGPLKRPHPLSEGPGSLSLLEDEAIGPHACRRLRRRYEAVNFQTRKNFEVVDTFWIDAKTSAIRRVVKEMQLDEGRSVGTLELEPEFDAEIPLAELAFDPPQVKP